MDGVGYGTAYLHNSKHIPHKLLTNYNVEEPGAYSHKQMMKISPIWVQAYIIGPEYGTQHLCC